MSDGQRLSILRFDRAERRGEAQHEAVVKQDVLIGFLVTFRFGTSAVVFRAASIKDY